MNLIKAVIGGLIGGAIGAAVWAFIAYATGYEIGWIAIGVGFLAGAGVRVGAGNDAGGFTGVLAAVIALASIGAGKYAVVRYIVETEVAAVHTKMLNEIKNHQMTDDEAMMRIAQGILDEQITDGKKLTWPSGRTLQDEREELAHFPKSIVTETKNRWKKWPESERENYKTQQAAFEVAEVEKEMLELQGEIERKGFESMFGGLDIVFAIFAVMAAFRVGSDSAD